MTTRIGAKGQVVIPKAVRDQAQLHPGDEVEIAFDEDRIVIAARRPAGALGGGSRRAGWPSGCWRIAVASRDERLLGLVGDPGLA
jgi:AbrB family looped-hinge helix DNA binding protein